LAVLALSAAMFVDDVGYSPAFCQAAEGCAAAREAATRWFGRLPLPLVSIVAYGALLGLALLPRLRWATRALGLFAVLGGLFGVALLLAQAFVLSHFCPYCVAIDLLSLVIAFFAWKLERLAKVGVVVLSPLRPVAIIGYALIALLAPVLWTHFRPAASVPVALKSLQVPQKVTLVEFVDAQCPHCRDLYPVIEQLKLEMGSSIVVRRLHAPLRTHLLAKAGARLLHCATDAAQAERLERGLFEAELRDEQSLVDLAAQAGMAASEVDACSENEHAERQVIEQIRLFKSLGRQGLPLTFVNGERIGGAMPKAVYRAAIARAQRPKGQAQGRAAAFFAITLMLGVALFFVGRQPPPSRAPTE
jgi:protein-disulfide isomerase/uncharacterized membrane protein